MIHSVRTSAAIAGLLVGTAAIPGCREEAPPKPAVPTAASTPTPAGRLSESQTVSLTEVADRVLEALDKLPRVETNGVPGVGLISPLGKLETPNLSDGVEVWSGIAQRTKQGSITVNELREQLPASYQALNQLYLYCGFYRQGHAVVLRQEDLFERDGHPRNAEQHLACAAQVQRADAARLQIAEAVNGLRTLADELGVPLIEKSPLEDTYDNISLKPGAQKALRQLLGFADAAVADLSESDRLIYIQGDKIRAAVLEKLPTAPPDLVSLDTHSFTQALSQTSIILLTAQSNQRAALFELMAEGKLENQVSSPDVQAYLKSELERANDGLNHLAELDWQLEFLGKFVEQMAAGTRILPDPKGKSKPPGF